MRFFSCSYTYCTLICLSTESWRLCDAHTYLVQYVYKFSKQGPQYLLYLIFHSTNLNEWVFIVKVPLTPDLSKPNIFCQREIDLRQSRQIPIQFFTNTKMYTTFHVTNNSRTRTIAFSFSFVYVSLSLIDTKRKYHKVDTKGAQDKKKDVWKDPFVFTRIDLHFVFKYSCHKCQASRNLWNS